MCNTWLAKGNLRTIANITTYYFIILVTEMSESDGQLQFIRALFFTDLGTMFVPPDTWMKIQRLVPSALRQSLHLQQWQQLLGLLTSTQALTQRGRLQLWLIQYFLIPYRQVDDCRVPICLPLSLQGYMEWWLSKTNVQYTIWIDPSHKKSRIQDGYSQSLIWQKFLGHQDSWFSLTTPQSSGWAPPCQRLFRLWWWTSFSWSTLWASTPKLVTSQESASS